MPQLGDRSLVLVSCCLSGTARSRVSSDAQYSTDRAGLSLSSLEHRALLARHVARYPRLGNAILEGALGYWAALLVTQVIGRWASDALVDAWIERARHRTV